MERVTDDRAKFIKRRYTFRIIICLSDDWDQVDADTGGLSGCLLVRNKN